jgi:hypothetical protein
MQIYKKIMKYTKILVIFQKGMKIIAEHDGSVNAQSTERTPYGASRKSLHSLLHLVPP